MLFTVIKKNTYQDSINLMLLTNRINELEGVKRSQIMMGTDANKDIFRNGGLLTDEALQAEPSDMMIVVESESREVVDTVLEETERFLRDLSDGGSKTSAAAVHSWEEALRRLPDANVALFSTPGEYTAPEIEKALDLGLHVFSFSDNVSKADEIRLKKKAHEAGLLLMGPDCGTGILSSVPVAFTNVVKPGNIGIVGASGTGIQEVTTIIDRLGGGVVHAIGTGGRDLNDDVGAVTVMDAVLGLEHHDPTDVICVISKPPAKQVRDRVLALLEKLSKPVVAVFIGEKPEAHVGKVYLAHTLEEAARISVDLAAGRPVKKNYTQPLDNSPAVTLGEDKTIKGLYSGGSLAAEAGMLISEAIDVGGLIKEDGYVLKSGGYEVVDLGDDKYTQGKPHPMIDPEVRIDYIHRYASMPDTGVIILDVMLGYGCHPNMAAALAPVVKEELEKAKKEGRELYFVGTVCGTPDDPQDYAGSVEIMKEAGVMMENTNAQAVRLALELKGHHIVDADKETVPYTSGEEISPGTPSEKVMELLNTRPRIINVGVESFNTALAECGARSVHYAWKPVAGGNKQLIHLLDQLEKHEEVNEANARVLERFANAQPFLVDIVPAKDVIPEINGKVLLHAGPPIEYKDMCPPMQGSCIGAVLFEKWAEDEKSARELLESGEVKFIPCHHVGAVGPMGGITSMNMPVWVVENRLDGTRAYCTMNEGIGKVLRFGAYSEDVIERLEWMRDSLGPTISEALKLKPEGLNLNVIIAKAIGMGDEFHQRNIAASLCLFKELMPLISQIERPFDEKQRVIKFLADTDQFFLNIIMATGKAIVDCARKIQEGCIVTTMSRNGRDFGIRISGMGDEWFTAPVNTPKGLYFSGFSENDASPDIGDSAITETIGVGGMAMVASPGVTRVVGGGGFDEACEISERMDQICISHNNRWPIPTWNFKGACQCIDLRKVVATGIEPLINTGIAHKKAGLGQIGAGQVRAPMACFVKALEAYCRKLGIE